ncbi:MAG: hypothetical protein IKS96_09605 [Fibrobacter sp.]|nr:hypothetical protein [Fibrobacter sp.]
MRKNWVLSVIFLWLLLFLSGCFDSRYDYISSFEDVGENSVTGSEQDSSLSNRFLNGQFVSTSKLVPVKVEVIAIDEKFKEKKTIAGKITEDGGVYNFSVDKFSYPTSLIKVRYTLKNPAQNFKMEFSQYANIANNRNLNITLASALKGRRIGSLIEDDAFSFDVADLKATRELYHILRLDSVTATLKSSDSAIRWTMNSYVETMSYSYLGGDFDSTFKKRFELLSHALKDEKSWWDSVSEVEIADDIIRNFKDRVIPLNSSIGIFANFWSGAYKLPACDSTNYLDEIQNLAKSSVYSGTKFVCNKGDLKNEFYYWHPLNKMEEEIGLCPLNYQCSKEYNDSVYVSYKGDLDWRLGNAKETVIHLYGDCDREKFNQVHTVRDTMFLCDRDYKSSFWTQNFDTSRVSHDILVEDRALRKYGKCSDTNNLVKHDIDLTDFVQCVDGKWINISDTFYYGDSCTEARSGEVLRTPMAKYYKCQNHWGKYAWVGIVAPEYYGDVCNADSDKKIVEYDSIYFKCNSDYDKGSVGWNALEAKDVLPPISHKDTCREKKVVKYGEIYYMCREKEWTLLTKEEAIPPVVEERPCGGNEEKTYAKYGEDYYICSNNKWSFVEKKNVPLPEIHGDICDSSYWGHIVEYENEYFICSRNGYSSMGYWSNANDTSIAVYEYNKTRESYCASGQVGTILEWNSKIDALMGCVKNIKTDVYEWGIVRPSAQIYTNGKEFVGGEFKTDGAYEVTIDGITYEFDGFRLSRESGTWNDNLVAYMFNHHVVIGGKRYEAEWADSNLYINSMRGEMVVNLSDIEPKSDSYSEFYEKWHDWVDKGNTCNDKAYGFHFPITSIQLKQYGEGTFVDWNTAKTFCPQGFHIPDTTEWKKSNIHTRTNAIATVEETYEPKHGLCSSKYSKNFVLLWSSTEKDDDTQYCYGYTTTPTLPFGDGLKGFLECPKDLFPLGQVMCVKDR